MRVLAGTLKGQRLILPRGSVTRPTSDRVRIACLDTLMPYLDGPFLDLFAGAGAVGIEALSRGAPSAVFVEQDPGALRALRDNIERLELGPRATVIRGDAADAVDRLARRGARFAAAFLDPPYGSPRLEPALIALGRGELLSPGEVVVLQHGSKAPPPERVGILSVWKARKFGETTLTFFRAAA